MLLFMQLFSAPPCYVTTVQEHHFSLYHLTWCWTSVHNKIRTREVSGLFFFCLQASSRILHCPFLSRFLSFIKTKLRILNFTRLPLEKYQCYFYGIHGKYLVHLSTLVLLLQALVSFHWEDSSWGLSNPKSFFGALESIFTEDVKAVWGFNG